MTQEEIIEMANKTDFSNKSNGIYRTVNIMAFAKLVAAKEQEKFSADLIEYGKAMAAVEREACAEICDRFQARDVGMQPAECAGAIRARGEA